MTSDRYFFSEAGKHQMAAREEVRKPRGRSAPSFRVEVAAPLFLYAAFTAAVIMGVTIIIWAIILDVMVLIYGGGIALAVTGWVCLRMFGYLLDHYHDLQRGEVTVKEMFPGDRQERGRWLEDTDDGRKIASGDHWRGGWKADLARLLFDSAGNWRGVDTVSRRLLAPLLVNESEKYPIALAELVRLGWVDNENDKRWTDKARADLRAALRFENNGGMT